MDRRTLLALALAGIVVAGDGKAQAASETVPPPSPVEAVAPASPAKAVPPQASPVVAVQPASPVKTVPPRASPVEAVAPPVSPVETVPPPASPTETVAPPASPVETAARPAAPVETAEEYPISRADYQKVKPQFRPQEVAYPTREAPGTIVIDTRRRFLYLVMGGGRAKRYGVGVGRWGYGWSGVATIQRKSKWPTWHPPAEMMERDREAAKWSDGMPGGPGNPLGARAMYLYQDNVDTLYRIHGTREPSTIGRAVSSGCVRMLNADAADLFERAPIGTKVVVLGPSRQAGRISTDFGKAFRSAFRVRPADPRKKKPVFVWRKVQFKPN